MTGLRATFVLVALILAVMCACVLSGCSSMGEALQAVKLKTQEAVDLADRLAAANATVVRKLCTDPASVSDEDKALAMRIADTLSLVTAQLRRVWGPPPQIDGGEP